MWPIQRAPAAACEQLPRPVPVSVGMRRTALLTVVLVLLVAAPAHATGATAVAIGPDGRASVGWMDAPGGVPHIARAGRVSDLPGPVGGSSASFAGDGLFVSAVGPRAVWTVAAFDFATP